MNIKVNKINHLINTLGYSEAFKYLKQIPVKSIDNSILKIYLTVCRNTCEHEFAFDLLERLKSKFGNDLAYLYQKALFFKDYGFVLKSIQILNFIRKQKIHPEEKKRIYFLMGEILWKSNKIHWALKFYVFFLKEFPKDVHIIKNILICYANLGEYEGALSQLNLLKKNSKYDCSESYRIVTQLKKITSPSDHLIDEIKALLKSELSSNSKSQLLFALGKAYEDLADYKASAIYYKEANKLKNDEYLNFNIQKKIEQFERLKKVYEQNISNSNYALNPCKSIFIVGMPRSGTTLIENILSSCEQVSAGGELSTYSKYFNFIFQYRFTNSYQKFLDNFEIKDLEDVGRFYNAEISNLYKKKYTINKLPHNFLYTGFINKSFQNTKIIHCVRNKNDILLSIFKNYFYGYLLDFVYDPQNLKHYFKFYEDVMSYWEKALGENAIFKINYEKLVDDPENELRLLFQYLEIPFKSEYLEFYKSSRGIKTLSLNQANKQIYKDSKYNWKKFEKYIPELF